MPTKLTSTLLLAALGYLGFFAFGLVMGVYGLWEIPALTIVALALCPFVAVHMVRVRRALRDKAHPDHDLLSHETSHLREQRGF